eukprot:994043-Prymnesium_polylepis.1
MPPQHIIDSTMNAAGGFAPVASFVAYSAVAFAVAVASLTPSRYVSGWVSLTAPAGISMGEYLE